MSKVTLSQESTLGNASIMRLIARFAIPSIISMLVTAAYNITDQIFIGKVVGMLGNGATNVVFPAVTFSVAFAQLFGVGTAANFSINMGARKQYEAKKYVYTGLFLMMGSSVLTGMLVWLFRRPILMACGATENIYPLAYTYLNITAVGLPFSMFSISASQLIRADNSPRHAMLCIASGAVINVFLDGLFYVSNGDGH